MTEQPENTEETEETPPQPEAREAMRLAGHKLPVKTKFVMREGQY